MSDQYPFYTDHRDLSALPPHPDLDEGNGWFYSTEDPINEYSFEGPQMDIYSFSIWTYDMAGNISTTYNTDITSTNYVISDLGNDNVVDFGADLGALGSSYDESEGDDYFNEYCDYGPLVSDVPKPNGYVGFDELVIAVGNYAIHGDWLTKGNRVFPDPQNKISPKAGEIIVATEIPERMVIGQEYTISITCDNPSAVAAYHMIFDYDNDKVEVVDITAGEMFNTEERTFFYKKAEGKELMLDGAIFGGEAQFVDNEIAEIKFRARADIAQFNIDDVVLDFRTVSGEEINSSFEVTRTIDRIIPTEFALMQNCPNPFNPTTSIQMALPVASDWTLDIYNIVGQKVAGFSGYAEAGIHSVIWDATGQASGIYFYRISVGDFTATKKMVLVK
jgi:hypothetical protein